MDIFSINVRYRCKICIIARPDSFLQITLIDAGKQIFMQNYILLQLYKDTGMGRGL